MTNVNGYFNFCSILLLIRFSGSAKCPFEKKAVFVVAKAKREIMLLTLFMYYFLEPMNEFVLI